MVGCSRISKHMPGHANDTPFYIWSGMTGTLQSLLHAAVNTGMHAEDHVLGVAMSVGSTFSAREIDILCKCFHGELNPLTHLWGSLLGGS